MPDTTTVTEADQIKAANASKKTPVVFIHGLWLLPSSWDRWAEVFEAAGYAPLTPIETMVEGADLVLVHEWNAPSLVAQLGRLRARGARFTLLFHDTHHRPVSEPEAMRAYGVLEGIP